MISIDKIDLEAMKSKQMALGLFFGRTPQYMEEVLKWYEQGVRDAIKELSDGKIIL